MDTESQELYELKGIMQTQQVYGVWYGGASYGTGDFDENVETFSSIKAARFALLYRARLGNTMRQEFKFVNQESAHDYTPCVDEDSSELHLFLTNPTGATDPYPDRIVKFGPRGGVILE